MTDLPTLTDHVLDLRFRHKAYRYGDISAILTWHMETGEPVLALVPAHRNLSFETVRPCLVPLKSAWMWDETIGDPRHAAANAHRFADWLGFNANDPGRCLQIAAIVRDLIEELIRTPPMPSDMTPKRAEMLIVDNATGKETVKEISDHV